VVETGAPHTTSVAFAGPALDVLVITTATDGLDPAALAEAPDSGRLSTADVGVTGRPTPYWKTVL
jgi:sugar lactone lactonase YvrE